MVPNDVVYFGKTQRILRVVLGTYLGLVVTIEGAATGDGPADESMPRTPQFESTSSPLSMLLSRRSVQVKQNGDSGSVGWSVIELKSRYSVVS
jgi:hypothetical protein